MPQVLIVCTANICRSPVAEALLRDRLQRKGLEGWTVSSAGTWALNESAPPAESIRLMAERGFDLSDHRAQMIERHHLAEADLVLCMEYGHAEALRAEFPEQAFKVHLISEMAGIPYNVKDPYGGSETAYAEMIEELEGLIDEGLDRISELSRQNAAERI